MPRTAPEQLLLRLEWRVLRRLEGQLAGPYRTAHRGPGTDLAGLRGYVAGDDARFIDWNVTARLNEAQVRVFNEDRELTVWLVVDQSASMTVGAPGRGKHDVATDLAVLLARMLGRGGNKVGALLYNNAAVRTVPPGSGRRHVLLIAAQLARTGSPAGSPAGSPVGSPAWNAVPEQRRPDRFRRRRRSGRDGTGRHHGPTDLAAMLDAVARIATRRSLIIVISDFIGDGDWASSLLRLGPRHEVVALRIVDPADEELPEAGVVVVEDTETGEQLVIDSGDPVLRSRLGLAVQQREAVLAAGMRRAGVPLHRVGTGADLATLLVDVVASTRRRRP